MKEGNRRYLLLAAGMLFVVLVMVVAQADRDTAAAQAGPRNADPHTAPHLGGAISEAERIDFSMLQDAAAAPDWLEPRGVNLVELVGQIPDEYLQGTILSYSDWAGIVVYQSGSRVENTVKITTTIYPRYTIVDWAPNNLLTMFGCLAQPPHYDHMGSVVPTSTLRVYDSSGTEVTSEILLLRLTIMDMLHPLGNSSEPFRYPEVDYGPGQTYPLPLEQEGLVIPPNSGCWIRIPGANYYPLTGVFTLEFEPSAYAYVRGSQEATFQSYIGVGDVGIFQPLMGQMRSTYPDRHERIPLSIPAGTDHFFLKFPSMPGDSYTDRDQGPPYLNASRLSGGTYRLSKDVIASSTNLVFAAAFPIKQAWRDSDQAGGSYYLPLIDEPTGLAPPEYVIPAGVPYNNCFTQGNCSNSVLAEIYGAEMTLEIVYLQVIKASTNGQWISLELAGPGWSPGLATAPQGHTGDPSLRAAQTTSPTHFIFLPFVSKQLPEEEPTGCPCGWFDSLGRMLDFFPGPEFEAQKPSR